VRILLTGSRDWDDEAPIRAALVQLAAATPGPHVLVHGACPTGGDAVADRIAADLGLAVERHPADWARYGKAAGYRRNADMVAAGADVCQAFIRDASPGRVHDRPPGRGGPDPGPPPPGPQHPHQQPRDRPYSRHTGAGRTGEPAVICHPCRHPHQPGDCVDAVAGRTGTGRHCCCQHRTTPPQTPVPPPVGPATTPPRPEGTAR
jgi:hypothetical protein